MNALRQSILAILILFAASLNAQLDVSINEFLSNNLDVNYDPDFYAFSDWIELQNNGNNSVDLKGYTLEYIYQKKHKWTFPVSTVIKSGDFLIIWADERNTAQIAHHTSFTLQLEGGKISLLSPARDTVSTIKYGPQELDISLGKNPENTSEYLFYAVPSPGTINTLPGFSSADRCEKPVFSTQGGLYDQGLEIELNSSSELAKIYYTLDGSKPSFSSPEYSGPISITSSTPVRAIAFDNSALQSRIETNSYLINEGISLPVVSISMEHDYFWDDEIGFYVEGTNGLTGWQTGYGPSLKSNFNRDWRRPMHIEFFDEDHVPGFSIEGQIKVYGGWSRGAVIKSFAVYPEKSINYQLFKEKPFENYESFIIRNSGNDWPSTKIRDAALQSLAINHLDVDLQANRPAVMFINGDFWGVLNLREKINEDYVYTNHGVHQDSVDFLERYIVVKAGDRKHYLAMMDYLSTHSLADQSNYEHFKTLVDVEECLNYFITGIYSGHGDWIYNGNNNLRLWRPKVDGGKWRWLLYDTDGAFTSSSGRGISDAMNTSSILSKILENDEAKNYFISTFTALLNNAFAPERAVHMVDSLKSLIEPDVSRHIEKWKNTRADGSLADWKDPGSDNFLQSEDGYMGPSLASFDQWESKFGTARSVASQRPGWLLNEIRSLFDLGIPCDIHCRLSRSKSGIILVNNVEVLDYIGTDTYMAGQELEFEAQADLGYKFMHWEVGSSITQSTPIIEKNSLWTYLDNGSNQGSNWRLPSFDDNSWSTGYGELGYGDGSEATIIDFGGDAANKYVCTYFRKQFTLNDPAQFDEFLLNVMRDDGIVVYLNGNEIIRDNMPAETINSQTYALNAVSNAAESTYYSFNIGPEQMQAGINTLAVEIHQISTTSTDISFDLELTGIQTSSADTQFIPQSKFSKTITGSTLIKAVFDTTSFENKLFVNEFMADNVNFSWPKEVDNKKDWIEIFNAGNKTVNIAGMYISDHKSNPGLYRIPSTDLQSTSISANSYLILYADGMPELGPDHLQFKLDRDSEEIALSSRYARKIRILDSLSFPSQIMDVTYGRYPDGGSTRIFMGDPTPNSSNRSNYKEPISGVYINEIMPDNIGIVSDNLGEFDDWIELYNANDYSISIAGLFLTDDLSNPTKYRIPFQYQDKTTIPAKGHLLFWADNDIEQGVNHLNFKLSDLKEQVGLFELNDQEIIMLDTLSYSLDARNISFGRYPDSGSNLFIFDHATPGNKNSMITALSLSSISSNIKISPNPTYGNLFIDLRGYMDQDLIEFEVEIYNMLGQLMNSRSIEYSSLQNNIVELDLSTYTPGLYLIKIVLEKEISTHKIILK